MRSAPFRGARVARSMGRFSKTAFCVPARLRGTLILSMQPGETGSVMDSLLSDETKSSLLTRAREAGYQLSERQLKRWHPLLPGSGQVHLKGTRGSETLYPPGTGNQLLVICELRWKHKIKR